MIGDDILVIPETGPDFLRALKAASLYSVRVHTCLPDISYERVSPLLKAAEAALRNDLIPECVRPYFERTSQYFRFIIDNARSFRLLADSGVLPPRANPDGLVQAMAQPPSTRFSHLDIENATRQVMDGTDPRVIILNRAFASYPPMLTDLIPLWSYLATVDKSWANLPNLDADLINRLAELFMTVPQLRLLLFALYQTGLSCVAEQNGIAVLCISDLHQQGVWAARDLFAVNRDGMLLGERKSIQALVGDAVIQRYLPDVDSLHFEDVLELRVRCKDELDAFRIGLREIAVEVDTTQPIERQRLQIEDVASTKVDPAVRNLQVSLWSARADILKKITPSWDSLAKATVPFLVSVAVGAPMNMQTALAAIGGFSAIAGPFIESEVERRKLLHASQWSVLLKLKKLGA